MSETIMVTGASGYAGRLIAAALLAEGEGRLVLPIRSGRDVDEILDGIVGEVQVLAPELSRDFCERKVEFVPIETLAEQTEFLAEAGVREIIHSAGCVDYFDAEKLEKGNIELTRAALDVGRRLGVERFTFISTAFSCGNVSSAAIPEALHHDHGEDLTEYTRSKRQAEWLVAQSGLPFIILRPSVLIGHSGNGRYSGKAYGLAQFWEGWIRLLCPKFREEIHLVVPSAPPPLLHQDDFQQAVVMARRHLEDGAIVNLVSPADELVPTRDLYKMMLETVRPRRAYFYPSIKDVPRADLDPALRAFLDFCSVNIEINERDWRFQRRRMEQLEARGMRRPRPTVESVKACLDYYVRNSPRMQRYFQRFETLMADEVEIVDRPLSQASETPRRRPARWPAERAEREAGLPV